MKKPVLIILSLVLVLLLLGLALLRTAVDAGQAAGRWWFVDPDGHLFFSTSSTGMGSGGGFRYYRLAPSLLEKDRWGNWVISRDYNAAMLSEAVCKLMGFTYAPSDAQYWMHGHSSEKDFIYVTTQSLTHDQLRAISEEVGEGRSLLICCKAFHAKAVAFPQP